MKNTIFLLYLLAVFPPLHAQTIDPTAIVASAGYYEPEEQEASLHFSIGELATEYLDEGQSNLSQGFLQTFMDLVPVETPISLDLAIQLGPNPCVDQVTLKQNLLLPLEVELYDVYGRRLKVMAFNTERMSISMQGLAAGNYFLRVLQEGQPVFDTYKLVKL